MASVAVLHVILPFLHLTYCTYLSAALVQFQVLQVVIMVEEMVIMQMKVVVVPLMLEYIVMA